MRRAAAAAVALVALSSCQMAFSTVGSWTKVGGPPAPLNGSWVLALPDGRVGVFGGYLPGGQPSNETAIYDPASGAWTKGAPMPGPLLPDVVTLLGDGTVLVEGGRDTSGKQLGDTWLYDPAHNHWTRAGSLIEPRGGPNVALLSDGRLMVAGGSVPLDIPEQTNNGEVDFKPIPSVEIYDPTTRQWSKAGALNLTRNGISLVPLGGGGAIAAGGCQGSAGWSPPSDATEVFDPADNTWSMTTPLPVPMCGAAGTLLRDGRALIVDQYTFTGVERYFYSSSDDAFVYDPKTRAWSLVGGLAGGGTDALVLSDGRVLVPEVQAGAQKGRTFQELVGGQIFDPSTNQWSYVTTTTLTMPIAYMFSGVPPISLSLADGSALVILETSAVAFHPQDQPPSTQILDSTGLTLGLGVALIVLVLLLVLAYRRATRSDASKLA